MQQSDADKPAGPSSAKKRKLMPAPDGFESTKRASGKAPARKFTSAFDGQRKAKFSSQDTLSHLHRRLQSIPGPVAGPSKEPLAPPKAAKAPMMRVSKIPVLQQPVAGPSSRSVQSRNVSILAAHRVSSPSAPNALPPKAAPKGSIQQFQPVLPPPPPSKDPPRNLRPLQPPPPPAVGPRQPDPSKMKTISTTRVAVAMDPSTEHGADELLGIYLEQQTANYLPKAERELQRGLGQSPEKASKSKSAKFVRGGLAERAQRIFAKHNTTLTLWYKDMELQAQRPQAHSRVAPDLSLRIVEVLHMSSVASLQRSQSVPRLCVVRCMKPHSVVSRQEEVAVVLDFGSPGSAAARAHTLDEVKEGKELRVWRPWNTVKTGEEPAPSPSSSISLPMLLGLTASCSIMFCTRFRIVQ
ncbi:hypothetical protein FKP32DRAFT_1663556 [Trametes sanguinea]|nr:hypothetical protein FKP32DRAFT_1663556 [Trametes sanguinea]